MIRINKYIFETYPGPNFNLFEPPSPIGLTQSLLASGVFSGGFL